MSAKWIEFLEIFLNVIQYKKGKKNVVVDALSRKYVLLNTLSYKLLSFEFLKELHPKDPIFAIVFKDVKHGKGKDGLVIDLLLPILSLIEGLLFKGKKLCMLMSSWRELFMMEDMMVS